VLLSREQSCEGDRRKEAEERRQEKGGRGRRREVHDKTTNIDIIQICRYVWIEDFKETTFFKCIDSLFHFLSSYIFIAFISDMHVL
jgi:hypothetical protein